MKPPTSLLTPSMFSARRSRRHPSPARPARSTAASGGPYSLPATRYSLLLLLFLSAFSPQPFSLSSSAAEHPWMLGPFTRPPKVNPIIKPDKKLVFNCPMNEGQKVEWAALHAFNPAAVIGPDGRICVLPRCEDASGVMAIAGHTSRIGLAESDDGLRFTMRPEPVFYPDKDSQRLNEWRGGCEDPRVVVTEDGTYVLTYTMYPRDSGRGFQTRLGIATSKDLVHWEKHGSAFEKLGGDFAKKNVKSGAILTRLLNDRLVAAKVNGKYWMYWGEGDVRLATSDDLINWTPGPIVLKRRPGKFDSALAEAGPPALLTDHGIVVIYNGKNADPAKNGAPSLKAGVYSGGQALFDAKDPSKLLQRPGTPFYKPEEPFERTGQYGAGTTFLEGLVYHKGKWFLYYGCADSFVAVAVANAEKQ